MAVERSLHRLLRIRELEEEQSRLAVALAMNELLELRRLQSTTAERDRRGRGLVEASLHSGEIPDRIAGFEECRTADRMARALAPRIWAAEQDLDRLRQDYRDRRVHRRQAETLLEEAEKQKAAIADKRTQQGLDEWYRHRRHGAPVGGAPDQAKSVEWSTASETDANEPECPPS